MEKGEDMEKSNSTLAIKWDIDHAISRTEKLLGLLEQAKEKTNSTSTLPGMTIGEALKQSPKKSASRFDENGCLITVTLYENKAGKHLLSMVNDQRPELTELQFIWSPTIEDLEATDWFPVKEMTTPERTEMLNRIWAKLLDEIRIKAEAARKDWEKSNNGFDGGRECAWLGAETVINEVFNDVLGGME